MLLPHIHREGLRHWHLQDRGTKVSRKINASPPRQLFAPEGPAIWGKIKE